MRTALQVEHAFVDTTLDTLHVLDGSVGVGGAVSWRWQFLGVDMGSVPAALRAVLPWLPPVWSEVDAHASGPVTGTDAATVFRRSEEGWTAQLPAGWTATVDGVPVQTLDGSWDGELILAHGDERLRAKVVEAPGARQRTSIAADPPLLGTLGMLGSVALLFAAVTVFAPTPTVSVDVSRAPGVAREVVLQVPAPTPPPPATAKPGSGGSSGPASGPGPRTDRQIAQSAGLLEALEGSGIESAGLDLGLASAVGSLRAGSRGGPHGPGRGLGDSLGGGGEIGGVDIGRPGGTPGGSGYGPGLFGKGTGDLVQVAGDPILVGALDPSLVDEVIKRHLAQIRYCYQRQLARTPSLAGTVVAGFTIAADGSVASASVKRSTLGDAAVEQCIVDRVRRMKFPEPRGRGVVLVSYPFLFTPG